MANCTCSRDSGGLVGTINVSGRAGANLIGTIGAAGFSGGTKDYEKLKNKPSINGVELIGNLSLDDLGMDYTINGIPLSGNPTLEDLGDIAISSNEIDTIIDEVFPE